MLVRVESHKRGGHTVKAYTRGGGRSSGKGGAVTAKGSSKGASAKSKKTALFHGDKRTRNTRSDPNMYARHLLSKMPSPAKRAWSRADKKDKIKLFRSTLHKATYV